MKRLVVAVPVIATVAAGHFYYRRLRPIARVSVPPDSLLARATPSPNHAAPTTQSDGLYRDMFAVRLNLPQTLLPPAAGHQPTDKAARETQLTTELGRAFFTSESFKLERFVLTHVLRITPGTTDDRVRALSFQPGDEPVPQVFRVTQRSSNQILSGWGMSSRYVAAPYVLTVLALNI